MAGLFVKQASIYAEARPTYPKALFSKLASLTKHHELAWDAGTGNGQAAISVAEHYERVIGTDISKEQLKHTTLHPKVRYIHTPVATPDEELVSMLGGDGSVDLITVAQAVHWFDFPQFYSLVGRVLRKPGGVFAVWGYNYRISPVEDMMKRFLDTTLPYWDPRALYVIEGYKNLPFPFENIGLGQEGEPARLEIEQNLSFEGLLGILKSWSAVSTAKEQGVDLLSDRVVRELEADWGGKSLVRRVSHKAFLLAGTPKID